MLIVGILLMPRIVTAQTVWAPPVGDDTRLPAATLMREAISRLTVNNIQIVLNETSLQRIARQVNAQVGRRGDAGKSLRWVCLTGTAGRSPWILWLESGEVHGDAVGAFRLEEIGNRALDRRCRTIKGAVMLRTGITLGVSPAAVERVFGKPSAVRGSTSLFVYQREEPNQFTTLNTTYVEYHQGAVVAIETWRTVTN